MQQRIYSIYQKIRNFLCERRSKPQIMINSYIKNYQASNQIIRQPIPIVDVDVSDSQTLLQQNQNSSRRSYDKIESYEKTQNKIKPKQSTLLLKYVLSGYFQQFKRPTDQEMSIEALIAHQVEMDNVLLKSKKIYQKIQNIAAQDEITIKKLWKSSYKNFRNQQISQQLSQILSEINQFPQSLVSQSVLRKGYSIDIQDTRDIKYSYELIDYPQIQYKIYCRIRNLWVAGQNNKKATQIICHMNNLKMLQKLTYKTFRTLSYGSWLNDQIINGYLQMLENKLNQNKNNSAQQTTYKILNSFFVNTVFVKSSQMIGRALKRKNITNKNKIIIALNNGNHWFFSQIRKGKVIVFDSIIKDKQYYINSDSTSDIFRNILRFCQWYYGCEHEIKVQQNYPQQSNSYDCGMFLLCGIKDIIRDRQENRRSMQESCWSFQQGDINYKRLQIAKELLQKRVSGFQEQILQQRVSEFQEQNNDNFL